MLDTTVCVVLTVIGLLMCGIVYFGAPYIIKEFTLIRAKLYKVPAYVVEKKRRGYIVKLKFLIAIDSFPEREHEMEIDSRKLHGIVETGSSIYLDIVVYLNRKTYMPEEVLICNFKKHNFLKSL